MFEQLRRRDNTCLERRYDDALRSIQRRNLNPRVSAERQTCGNKFVSKVEVFNFGVQWEGNPQETYVPKPR